MFDSSPEKRTGVGSPLNPLGSPLNPLRKRCWTHSQEDTPYRLASFRHDFVAFEKDFCFGSSPAKTTNFAMLNEMLNEPVAVDFNFTAKQKMEKLDLEGEGDGPYYGYTFRGIKFPFPQETDEIHKGRFYRNNCGENRKRPAAGDSSEPVEKVEPVVFEEKGSLRTLRAYEVLARVLVILATDLDLNPALLENVFHKHRVINYKQSQGQNRWMLYFESAKCKIKSLAIDGFTTAPQRYSKLIAQILHATYPNDLGVSPDDENTLEHQVYANWVETWSREVTPPGTGTKMKTYKTARTHKTGKENVLRECQDLLRHVTGKIKKSIAYDKDSWLETGTGWNKGDEVWKKFPECE